MADQMFYRDIPLDTRAVDAEKRQTEVTFSSEEAEVRRWFGLEILSHREEEMDLSVLRSVGSHLFNHNRERIIGPVIDAGIKEGKGSATIGYDDTEEGNLALIRTKNKSLRGVSCGYTVERFRKLEPGEAYRLASREVVGREDVPIYIATKWTPREISSTPVPADPSVGIGREAARSLEGIEIESVNHSQQEAREMDETKVRQIIEEMRKEDQAKIAQLVTDGVRSVLAEQQKPQMRITAEKAQELLGRAGAISTDCKVKVCDMIFEGRTEAEIINYLLDTRTSSSDASNSATGAAGDGTGTSSAVSDGKRMLDSMSDDAFARMVNSPGVMVIK